MYTYIEHSFYEILSLILDMSMLKSFLCFCTILKWTCRPTYAVELKIAIGYLNITGLLLSLYSNFQNLDKKNNKFSFKDDLLVNRTLTNSQKSLMVISFLSS